MYIINRNLFIFLVLTEVNSFVLLLQFFNRYSPNLLKMRWSSFVVNHKNAPFTSRLHKLISLFISSKNDLLSVSYKGQSIKDEFHLQHSYHDITGIFYFITYWFYLSNFIGYHAVTWHFVKFDIVWLKIVLTWFHFRFRLM